MVTERELYDLSIMIIKRMTVDQSFALFITPHLRDEHFDVSAHRWMIRYLKDHITKFSAIPSLDMMKTTFYNKGFISNAEKMEFEDAVKIMEAYSFGDTLENTSAWARERAEFFIKNRGIYATLLDGIHRFMEGESIDDVPDRIVDSLAFSFDTVLGHSYNKTMTDRFDYYSRVDTRYPCHLETLNKVTGGGFMKKTLNVFMGAPGIGKSQMMVDLAVNFAKTGLNVLFISLELAEHVVAIRCDANVLGVAVNDIPHMTKADFVNTFNRNWSQDNGELIIKEYPTASVSVNHIRTLLRDLKSKKSYVPDVIIVDYIGCLLPSNRGKMDGMYQIGKTLAEDLRRLAVETDTIVFSPVQVNREAYGKTNIGMENVAESAAIGHVADFCAAFGATVEDLNAGLMTVNIIKNRLNDRRACMQFMLEYESKYMRFYECSQQPNVDVMSHIDQIRNRGGKIEKKEDEDAANKRRVVSVVNKRALKKESTDPVREFLSDVPDDLVDGMFDNISNDHFVAETVCASAPNDPYRALPPGMDMDTFMDHLVSDFTGGHRA